VGLAISEFNQLVLDVTPTIDDLGGKQDIAIFSAGKKHRHKYFSRVFSDQDCKYTLHYPEKEFNEGSKDASPLTNDVGNLMQDVIAAAGRIENIAAESLRILLDVSCLSRQLIAQVFAAIAVVARGRTVHLRIAYSLAAYSPSPSVWATPNRTVCPVHPAFSGWNSEGPSLPLDVIVGLGYEKGKALGAVEYLEPRHRWIYVPESPETAYLAEVEKHNKNLIANCKDRVAQYQLMSPVETYFSLRSLVEGIAMQARPVLLPFGPKLFFAVNLLVAMTVEEAAVWYVNGESDDYSDRRPSRYSAIMECVIRSTDTT